MSTYYREKILKLHDALFLSPLSGREKFQQLEKQFDTVYLASKDIEDTNIRNKWEEIWQELNKHEGMPIRNHEISSFMQTVGKSRNKTLEKYLHFVLEEFYRVL